MENITFANPHFFWLLLLLPLLLFWKLKKQNTNKATIKISSIAGFNNQKTLLSKTKPYLYVLQIAAFLFLIIALARPRIIDAQEIEGIDIVMAIDVSTSLMATDLKPNRLEALKKTATKFVANRETDRVGLVIYAGEAYTRIPLTTDKEMVADAIANINFDGVIDDGTAIGMGLTTAINRLKESTAKSKVIILLTDGVNNGGFIEPETAADIAHQYGIKVYTIGIGTNGYANYPVAKSPITGEIIYQQLKVEIDEDLLKQIAIKTNGNYYRATNNEKLESIYNDIDKLEKTKLQNFKPNSFIEKFRPFAIIALLLLALYFVLKNTIYKGIV